MTGIEQAIEIAGSESKLAALLGCSQQAINKMKRRGYVPPTRADQIAAMMKIDRTALIDPALRAAVLGEQK